MRLLLIAACLPVFPAGAAENFPKKEAEIGFGKTLADFGVVETRTVCAKDFGFDPSNATRAVQQALDSGATTVVLDAMPSPWYLDTVEMRSNRRIVVRKGAKVLRDCQSPLLRKGPMFRLRQTANVVIEGEGSASDASYVGGYASWEERKAQCKWYGQSVFALDRATNTVIRNLHVADSEEDGVVFGGDLRQPSVDTWLEDLDLTSHYRQACSICCARGVYAKRVAFRNTRGNEPSAGIDIEPCYPCSPNTDIYLFDCLFEKNTGQGVEFATCSDFPIRFYATRCTFRGNVNPAIGIPARGEAYMPKGVKADVKIVFEDCSIETPGNIPAIQFWTAPLFDVTFRNLTITQGADWSPWRPRTVTSPFGFTLDRDYTGEKGFKPNMTGVATFKDVKVTGFAGPLLAVKDELGKQDLRRAFKGVVAYNGTNVNLASFSYAAPDVYEPVPARVPVKDLAPLARSVVRTPGNAVPNWHCKWYQKWPEYSYYFFAEKGAEVSFDIVYPAKIVYADMAKELQGKRLVLDTVGGDVDLGPANVGTNRCRYVARETGWCSFRPPRQGGEGNAVPVLNVVGATLAVQNDTLGDGIGKFALRDEKKDYRGYFEVPPNIECQLRVTSGALELYDADGKRVDACDPARYVGRHVFRFRTKGDKPEVWSFRTPPGGGTRTLRFYAPLNGIWADAPELLPQMGSSPYDWEGAKEVVKGVKVIERTLDSPRLMRTYLMRVDLKTPGLRFTGTERAANYGEPMPDVTNRTVIVDTRREKTVDFMQRRRAAGDNMLVAFNSAPWGPFEPPWTHKFAHFDAVEVSDGVKVSHAKGVGPTFVAWKDGRTAITNRIDEADHANIAVAHSGFGVILRDGVLPRPFRKPGLAPRIAYGLSKDGRWLYLLAVDGRQPGWSLGADMYDLATELAAAGADDAINVDGGGSTTLVYWDEAAKKPVTLNRHDPQKLHYRPVALNVGLVYPLRHLRNP